jgi:hypothetical protein
VKSNQALTVLMLGIFLRGADSSIDQPTFMSNLLKTTCLQLHECMASFNIVSQVGLTRGQ